MKKLFWILAILFFASAAYGADDSLFNGVVKTFSGVTPTLCRTITIWVSESGVSRGMTYIGYDEYSKAYTVKFRESGYHAGDPIFTGWRIEKELPKWLKKHEDWYLYDSGGEWPGWKWYKWYKYTN